MDVASLHLVAAQPRPDPTKDHSSCAKRKCCAYDVEEGKYIREHAPDCDRSACRDLGVDSDELHQILKSGLIPVTRYIEDSTGKCYMEVVPAQPGTQYVAISHVWSDGLGDPDDNSLFSCQAKQIARYVAAAMGSSTDDIPFWIDTLSCPVLPEEATDLAIAMMRETYADAEKTVVLNSHLLTRKKPALCIETLAIIVSSSWTRRLWTLQEGVLAKEVVFQFLDESITLDTAIGLTQLELQRFLEPNSLEYAALLNMATTLRFWSGRDQTLSESLLILLHSELQWRSTSVPTDEPLCISALLGFPLKDIMSVCIDCRKAQFWRLVRHPPRRILFWSGKRMETPGFRWAPESLLAQSDSYFVEGLAPTQNRSSNFKGFEDKTEVTEDGLLVRGDTFLLGEWKTGIAKGFFLKPQLGPLLWVARDRSVHLETVVSDLTAPTSKDHIDSEIKHLSLLLQKPGEDLLSPTGAGAISALLISHSNPESSPVMSGTIEDICSIFPAHFLIEQQKQIFDQNVELYMGSLGNADSATLLSENHPPATDSLSPEAIPKTTTKSSQESLPLHQDDARSNDGEHFYVCKGGDGLCRIEWNGVLWWTESSVLLLNQQWCLD